MDNTPIPMTDATPNSVTQDRSAKGFWTRMFHGFASKQSAADTPRRLAVSYNDIGGLTVEVARIREMVELPLRSPQIFSHLGIDPPKGVLLYGPPGSGKTLIARAVAHETGAYFISVNGPEIIQKHYGESEELLRGIFAEAQKHPAAIIFFDEIDALAPNRETVLGDVEKRVVAQLLALMDGLATRGQIVVIAATNLPNSVDPALRRPGRFDREIAINPPDKTGREDILRIHTRTMPLATDVDLTAIAALTPGYLGADLAALCREAAMVCARDMRLRYGVTSLNLDSDILARIQVDRTHFERALDEVELSTTRQLTTAISDVCWNDIGGLTEVKRILHESIEWPLKYADRFAHVRAHAPKGILLTGASGTGKTLLAKAMANEAGINFLSIKGPELFSKWVGESERGIREVFKKARQSAPAIVFFDEIDAIASSRSDSAGINERMVGQLLLELDNIEARNNVIVLAATNRPDLIDKAILRPGRFDYVIALPLPDENARQEILAIHCDGRRLNADVNLAAIAHATAGMSGADLEALCRRAALAAISDSIARDPGLSFQPFEIENRHFTAASAAIGRH